MLVEVTAGKSPATPLRVREKNKRGAPSPAEFLPGKSTAGPGEPGGARHTPRGLEWPGSERRDGERAAGTELSLPRNGCQRRRRGCPHPPGERGCG